eukprot:TRINITY_DN1093_c1_g1_i5.p1 TRINITY_DN1093_c1_g1~~TRINITY_DN1093_c1_g1_i5.p1  ORF type:complete len:435 (-),score=109.68 TRINITY_DN1093_c1_g1_i5:558-1862(-)
MRLPKAKQLAHDLITASDEFLELKLTVLPEHLPTEEAVQEFSKETTAILERISTTMKELVDLFPHGYLVGMSTTCKEALDSSIQFLHGCYSEILETGECDLEKLRFHEHLLFLSIQDVEGFSGIVLRYIAVRDELTNNLVMLSSSANDMGIKQLKLQRILLSVIDMLQRIATTDTTDFSLTFFNHTLDLFIRTAEMDALSQTVDPLSQLTVLNAVEAVRKTFSKLKELLYGSEKQQTVMLRAEGSENDQKDNQEKTKDNDRQQSLQDSDIHQLHDALQMETINGGNMRYTQEKTDSDGEDPITNDREEREDVLSASVTNDTWMSMLSSRHLHNIQEIANDDDEGKEEVIQGRIRKHSIVFQANLNKLQNMTSYEDDNSADNSDDDESDPEDRFAIMDKEEEEESKLIKVKRGGRSFKRNALYGRGGGKWGCWRG